VVSVACLIGAVVALGLAPPGYGARAVEGEDR
jgi:hypothetical protein